MVLTTRDRKLPDVCEVTDVQLQDPFLKETYMDLPNLRYVCSPSAHILYLTLAVYKEEGKYLLGKIPPDLVTPGFPRG